MKKKGVKTKQRKYILRVRHLLHRGILTFEYLSRRRHIKPCRKLTISQPQKAAAKGATKDKKEPAKK
jgi:hypothetical protein